MARTVHNRSLDSRSARAKLIARREPYWTKLTKGCFVGYRKSARNGSWIGRWRDSAGRQHFRHLGAADDVLDSDGANALSCAQAQVLAREWFDAMAASAEGRRKRGIYTVADCMADYLAYVRAHRKSARHLETYVRAYILPKLGALDTARLTSPLLEQWHREIAAEPPRLRSGTGKARKYRAEDPDPDEALRKRRLRANRHLVTLRAALNRAWREGLIARNDAWARLQIFRGTERQRTKFLDHAQARRLINTCEPDLRQLVQSALMTGARYGELCKLEVRDFCAESGTLFVRDSKSSKPRRIYLNEEGVSFFAQVSVGRMPREALLRKTDGACWSRDLHHRPFKAAVLRAGLDPAFTFHELRHTYASHTLMNGAHLMAVAANLGHRDTRMVEQHYGHLADNHVRDVIRKSAPSFGLTSAVNVLQFAT
jgi:integrase